MIPGATNSATSRRWRIDGFEMALLRGPSPAREQFERRLLDIGRPLPLPHRAAWAPLQQAATESWFLAIADAEGRPVGGAAIQVARSRALPGHLIARSERFGPGVPAAAQRAALEALATLAREQRRIIRLSVETFAIDPEERAQLEGHARSLGFSRVEEPRSYEHTLLVALDGDETSIFASIHKTARQNVRAADKNPVQVRPIDDPAFFDRLDELSRETYDRTGGRYDPADWARIVALSAAHPSASRLVGLFRTDRTGPASLLAFAWGCGHGDHAHYSRAASTRNTDLRMPLMYPVVWDLIRWARANGARHFDFGGVTLGNQHSADPLGGISDFKRYFSRHLEQVGAEWSLEPRPLQARAARLVSAASMFLSRIASRSRRTAAVALTRPAAATAPVADVRTAGAVMDPPSIAAAARHGTA